MKKYLPALLLVLLGVSSRLLPHPANFAPIAAIGLFAGMYLPKKFAFIIPAAALFTSDILLGFYTWQVMVAVYGCFAITSVIGLFLSKHKNLLTVASGTLSASIIFFIITNYAVWAFGTMYPHTVNGLFQSYMMALPFFKNSVLGDMFYTGMLVGSMEAIRFIQTKQQQSSLNQTI
jgi:hypothetical protein